MTIRFHWVVYFKLHDGSWYACTDTLTYNRLGAIEKYKTTYLPSNGECKTCAWEKERREKKVKCIRVRLEPC